MSVTSFFSFLEVRRATRVAACLLFPLWLSTVHAEGSLDSAPQASDTLPAAASATTVTGGAIGGFFSNLGNSINNVVTGSRDKLQFLDLAPGTYQKSNEAIGEQKDIDENRITRGVLSVPSFTNYANVVLGKLKDASAVEQVPGQVIVVANDQMDAGATADGNIFISSGYIRELKNEDQLAALLAHELSHVLLRHHDSNAFSRVQKQISTLTAVGMNIRNAVDKSTGGAASSALSPGQKEVLQQMELLISISDIALSPAWGRRQEAEGDRLGMDLMVKAGYSYQDGLIPWLETVAKWDAIQDEKKAVAFKKQQASMQALIAGGKFDDSIKQGLGFALNDIKSQLSAGHEGGEKRINDIDAYFIKAYNEKVPKVAPTTSPYEQARNKPDVKLVLADYSKVFQARSLVTDQKYADAQGLLKPLLVPKSQIAGHALPNQLMFEALRGLGRRKEAEVYLSKSLQSNNSVWAAYDSAATYFKDQGNEDAIGKVGQSAFQRFSGAPSAYPRLIALYKRNGLTKNMNAVMAECALKQADKRDQCLAATQ
ncbi:M48 family metalloprotease [Polaromonas sp.]|uniref:M48 family metalloprotease n=1 Tax=Polaromonas sp. TaxID=1869339 RepID=UPI001811AF63|nr:M48 family metalloprotease [Polaromonas sp.]NMM06828.1 M48 family metalloprotease [Polaromonas sp.]